jgi:precorrin-8X/cobalt-precorrin-8 methylmutase
VTPKVTDQLTRKGRQIEADSFAIVDAEAGDHGWAPDAWQVVRRVVHATADFDFVRSMEITEGAIAAGVAALRRGAPIVADVAMIAAGLSLPRLEHFGVGVHSHIADPDVIADAKAGETTRAVMAMRKAKPLLDGGIAAVGNAPTALLEIARMVREDGVRPALVVGVPVGFVSAAESKEVASRLPAPTIVCRGRKGGTSVAVAVIHALLALAEADERSRRAEWGVREA